MQEGNRTSTAPIRQELIRLALHPLENRERIETALVNIRQTGELASWIAESLQESRSEKSLALCHETATHYKWLIAFGCDPHCRVWVHEFKDDAKAAEKYAAVPHDHRYPFASAMLTGSYINRRWTRKGDSVYLESEALHEPGEVLIMDPTEVHSLSAIAAGTLTLVLEGIPAREYSNSWTLDGKSMRTHRTFADRWADLDRKVRFALNASLPESQT